MSDVEEQVVNWEVPEVVMIITHSINGFKSYDNILPNMTFASELYTLGLRWTRVTWE